MMLNHKKWSAMSKKSDEFMENVENNRGIATVKDYFELCSRDISDFFFEARKARRNHLHDVKQFAVSVFVSLYMKDVVIRRCLEKIYTMSNNTSNMNFTMYNTKVGKILAGDFFDTQYSKLYKSFASGKQHTAKKIKEVFYHMLDTLRDTNFKILGELKNEVPPEAEKLIKKLYVGDKAFKKFGIEDEELLNSKVLQKDQELQKMFGDIVKGFGK